MTSDIKREHREQIVKTIRIFHPAAKIMAFGSRVNGTAHKYSDIDVAVDIGRSLTFNELDVLSENFANTNNR